MLNYIIWLKNRIIDVYLNWKYGEVILTKEEVENMRAMFSYIAEGFNGGDEAQIIDKVK